MATVINDLYDHIDASGAATGYTKQTVFLEQYTDTAQRYLLVRNQSGLSGTVDERNHSFSILHISKVSDTGIEAMRDDADALVKYFLQNYTQGCIIGVDVVGDVAGPFQMDSGRWFYKIDINVKSATS